MFIEKARQLKVPEGNTVDPIVEVTVNGERKFSTAKDDISSAGTVTWNEHLFFEPKNMVSDSAVLRSPALDLQVTSNQALCSA